MSAATAAPSHASRRFDPVLLVALVAMLLLAAAFVAPRAVTFALSAPFAAPTPAPLHLVVADLRGHALVVIDTGDPDGARRIPLPGGPHEFAALPDGRVAVSLEQFGTVAIVDPASGDVRSLRIGGTPHGLAVSGDSLYVTDRSVNAVRRFALDGWAEGAPVAAGAWPHIVEARPDGSLSIANAADDTVTLGGHAVPVSHVPESIAVAPDGRVATAGAVGGLLEVLDARGVRTEQYQVNGRPVRLRYDPRGAVLAASLSASGAVAVVQDGRVRQIAVGGVPDGLAFSPDGRWLYVADMYGGGVSVVDVERSRVAQHIPVAGSAGALLVLSAAAPAASPAR